MIAWPAEIPGPAVAPDYDHEHSIVQMNGEIQFDF